MTDVITWRWKSLYLLEGFLNGELFWTIRCRKYQIDLCLANGDWCRSQCTPDARIKNRAYIEILKRHAKFNLENHRKRLSQNCD